MKFTDVVKLVEEHKPFRIRPKKEYYVCFEHAENGICRVDRFPEPGENPFTDPNEAWEWAHKFAQVTYGKCVNIFVSDENYMPIYFGAYERKIYNR